MMAYKRNIQDIDDYIGEAVEVFERFLESFTIENRLIRPINEDDSDCENFSFMYTTRGIRLAERMRGRLYKLGYKLFPDTNELEIETHLYQES